MKKNRMSLPSYDVQVDLGDPELHVAPLRAALHCKEAMRSQLGTLA